MRVSVLVTMPTQAALRASALNASMIDTRALLLDEPPRGAGLVLDSAFPAVPIPGATADTLDMTAATAASAPIFVTRGTVDVARLEEITERDDGVGVFADPEIGTFLNCPGRTAVGSSVDVARHLDLPALQAKGLNGAGVAVAIMDTGINLTHLRFLGLKPKLATKAAWIPIPGSPPPGTHPVGHGTMCAFDALIGAPHATLLDFPILRPTAPGGTGMGGLLSNALQAYSHLLRQLTAASWKYRGLIVNNSWGMYHPSWDFPVGHPGRYADNPNHPFNLIVGTLARAGADIVFAAGNCGADCPDSRCQGLVNGTITGANAHPDVTTVAACDINRVRLGYSSQGPGVAGMAHDKPDLTAYSHFLGSQACGVLEPDVGTSAACPVVAGCLAAIRTRLAPNAEPPAGLSSVYRATALGIPHSGWNPDYGYGVIQPLATAAHYGL